MTVYPKGPSYARVLTEKGQFEHFQRAGRFGHLTLCGRPVAAERTAQAAEAFYQCLTCARAARS